VRDARSTRARKNPVAAGARETKKYAALKPVGYLVGRVGNVRMCCSANFTQTGLIVSQAEPTNTPLGGRALAIPFFGFGDPPTPPLGSSNALSRALEAAPTCASGSWPSYFFND